MDSPANDVRPLQPIVFLTAAIRAEVADLNRWDSAPVYSPFVSEKLNRIRLLCTELDRHAEGNPK